MSITLQVCVLYNGHFDVMEFHAGLRLPVDQRHITSSLPMHLADAFTVNEAAQPFPDGSNNSKSLLTLL